MVYLILGKFGIDISITIDDRALEKTVFNLIAAVQSLGNLIVLEMNKKADVLWLSLILDQVCLNMFILLVLQSLKL